MHSILLIINVFLSLPLSYALIPTVSFSLYIECLETNPHNPNAIGLPIASFTANIWNLGVCRFTNAQGQTREYVWQVYPSPRIEPIRPARPPGPFFNPRYLAAGQCTHLPPGVCCRTVGYLASNGHFANLPRGAISAFWGPSIYTAPVWRPNPYGCTGGARILDSRYDTSRWAYQDDEWYPRITGASYILCPSSGIEQGWGAILKGFCARAKRRGAAGLMATSAPAAAALVKPEVKQGAWVWPDLITVDGVTYTDDGRGDLLYYSSEKELLNLTGWRI